VRSLTLAYTLAGADCIDVAADPAVIRDAKEAIQVARNLVKVAQARGLDYKGHAPLLMVIPTIVLLIVPDLVRKSVLLRQLYLIIKKIIFLELNLRNATVAAVVCQFVLMI
jgi:hypothetical protein